MRKYKFVYLMHYAINIGLVIALLIITRFNIDVADRIQEKLQFFMGGMGVIMVISLWSKAWIANEGYNGVGTLDGHITRAMTFSLAIIEFMTIYSTFEGHEGFFRPASVGMGIWMAAMLWAMFGNKKFITRASVAIH